MQMQIAVISEDNKKLDKRPMFNLAEPITINMQLYTPCDIDNPTFILSNEYATNYNYAYVPKWDKYYFLGEPTIIDGNRCTIPGKCDVLTTYADSIGELTVNIIRQETNKNPYIMDRHVTKTGRTYTENYYFSSNPFSPSTGTLSDKFCYLLSVVGGDGTGGI